MKIGTKEMVKSPFATSNSTSIGYICELQIKLQYNGIKRIVWWAMMLKFLIR